RRRPRSTVLRRQPRGPRPPARAPSRRDRSRLSRSAVLLGRRLPADDPAAHKRAVAGRLRAGAIFGQLDRRRLPAIHVRAPEPVPAAAERARGPVSALRLAPEPPAALPARRAVRARKFSKRD